MNSVTKSPRGWLLNSKENQDQRREGEGYPDVLGETYVWKADLPNGKNVSTGDVIAIWDSERLLGVSRIEGEISSFDASRTRYRCRACNRADVRPRKNKIPRFACQQCSEQFEIPVIEEVQTTYRVANYAPGWVPISKFIGALECRSLAVTFGSQHSIRPIVMGKLEQLLDGLDEKTVIPFIRRNPEIYGGHILRTVRTRLGQDNFRKKQLKKFGSNCAVTGNCPDSVLDAAHLYSYSEVGVHHDNGGLLLRKDIHRLFDKGDICIHPETGTIDIDGLVRKYPSYEKLHGQPIQVDLSEETRDWLQIHWEQFRSPSFD
jgi:hypothetical protein